MVKLGSNLTGKPEREEGWKAAGDQAGDDGFDSIPLLTPLDVSQLEPPFPDKVIVKTTTEYQLQQNRKKKLYVPGIKKLNINLYDEVSEKVKLTGLILITMAFLACLLLLIMYKALWYDQLSCPEGFVFKPLVYAMKVRELCGVLELFLLATKKIYLAETHKHCTPAALEMYFSQQDSAPRSSLYTAISHLNQAKRTIPELLPSSWLPVINALKDAEKATGESGHSRQ